MPETDTKRGTLVLVVGPSGSGKDTVIDGAREALADNPNVVFVRRTITRPAEAGGENHIEMSPEEFAAAMDNGDFALAWHAHGLDYGIPKAIEADLAAGKTVIANVSRAVIGEARTRYAPVAVASLNVSPNTLRWRLVARGRETPAEIEERVARASAYDVEGDDVTVISNDGTPEEAISAFMDMLERVSA